MSLVRGKDLEVVSLCVRVIRIQFKFLFQNSDDCGPQYQLQNFLTLKAKVIHTE